MTPQFQQAGRYLATCPVPLGGTWGAWTELVASLPFRCRWVALGTNFQDDYYNPHMCGVQLGIGPAGSETVWLPSTGDTDQHMPADSPLLSPCFPLALLNTYDAGPPVTTVPRVPLHLFEGPAEAAPGVRISARAHTVSGTGGFNVYLAFMPMG